MRTILLSSVCVLCLGVMGCKGDAPPPPAAVAPAKVAAPKPPPMAANAPAGNAGAAAHDAEENKARAWVAKMEAGMETFSACKRAWGILNRTKENAEKMIAEAPADQRGSFPPPPVLPPEKQFTDLCDQLPPPVQNCMSMTYYMMHGEDCRTVLGAMDAPSKAKFDQLRGLVK